MCVSDFSSKKKKKKKKKNKAWFVGKIILFCSNILYGIYGNCVSFVPFVSMFAQFHNEMFRVDAKA